MRFALQLKACLYLRVANFNKNEPKSDMDTTIHELNSLHDNLKFTSECEKDSNFHFLDVNIKFMDDQFYTST